MTSKFTPKNLVIYADDDPDDIEMVKEGFSTHSANVQLETFTDGDEVLHYLEKRVPEKIKPCLIILDMNMPRMDGRETLSRIRNFEELQTVPVIMFTTSSHPLDKKFATENKAGFITKPVDVSQLNIIINHFIDHCEENVQGSIRNSVN